MISRSTGEVGDAMRQRDVVIVEKDDELALRCGKAEVPRAGYAEAGTAHDTKRNLETCGGGVELVTVIDND